MSTTSTADLVDTVLNALSGAAAGEDEAARKLAEQADAEKEAAAAPEPDKLKGGTKVIKRPNGEDYHVRKLNGHDDVEVLRKFRSLNIPILEYGPPGTGKTAGIEAAYFDYTPEHGSAKVYTVQGTGDTETADFIGGFVQTTGGDFVWEDGPLLRAMEEGAVLYIDEIALIDPKVLALVYGVMDGRDELRITANPERGVVKAQPGFYVIAACNPNAPGARMSEALVSRFRMQFLVKTDYALAKTLGVEGKIVNAAQNLAKRWEKNECSWAPQLRELLAFKEVQEVLGTETALRNMVAVAPEMDRGVVKDVLSRTYAKDIKELSLSGT